MKEAALVSRAVKCQLVVEVVVKVLVVSFTE
jgi:hypothetical protein